MKYFTIHNLTMNEMPIKKRVNYTFIFIIYQVYESTKCLFKEIPFDSLSTYNKSC